MPGEAGRTLTACMTAAAPAARPHPHAESIRDTLISVIIAFTLAFVFRGFVIEAFVIPTGSMAPTLMGAHMRFHGPGTGYSWPVGPWDNPSNNEYSPVQNDGPSPIVVHDPMSGEEIARRNVPLRSGDRILVLKYLYSLMEPQRFDVVVFKNPTDPAVNYIKRLVGLPGEEVALVDGDVFTRPSGGASAPASTGVSAWEQPGWRIARKTRAQQLALWQPIFDSAYTPLDQTGFSTPWNSESRKWDFSRPGYRFDDAGATELFFDQTRRRFTGPNSTRGSGPGGRRVELWTIDDRYAYDETPGGQYVLGAAGFPVSDLRIRGGIEPRGAGLKAGARIRARGMEFEAMLDGAAATLRVRRLVGEAGVFSAWENIGAGTIRPLAVGRVTDFELCHVDQSVQLYVDGRLVIRHDYDWSPAERIAGATGRTLEQIMADATGRAVGGVAPPNPLADGDLYRRRPPDVRWVFNGAPFTLHRVGLDRDLHYQPVGDPRRTPPGLATSPMQRLVLNGDQFFCCGDNSPQSLDGRLWGDPEAWVAFEFDKAPGVVPRDLMLGKAFFVYWPAPHWNTIPIPDFGRMRFIR